MQKIKDCIRACDFGDNFIDPYIKVALMPWHIYAQTKHVDDYDREKMGDEIPFNEKLGLELPDDPKTKELMLVVQAWDEDVGVDELIGQGVLSHADMQAIVANPGLTKEMTCELNDHTEDNVGIVKMEITFKPHKEDAAHNKAAWDKWDKHDPKAALAPGEDVELEEEFHGRIHGEDKDPSVKVARFVDGSAWKEGDAILGHFTVNVVSATGLKNPARQVSHVDDDPVVVRKAAAVAFLYFAVGAVVFNRNCVTEHDGVNEYWTFVDTVYFGIVTITTTGYGDLLPNHFNCNNGTMVFTCFYTFIGVGMIASALGFLVGRLLEIKATGSKQINDVQVVAQVPDDCIERLQWVWSNWTTILNPVYQVTKHLPNTIRPTVKAFSYWALLKVVVLLYFINADPRPDDPDEIDCSGAMLVDYVDYPNHTVTPSNCGVDTWVDPTDSTNATFVGLCDAEHVSPMCSNWCDTTTDGYTEALCVENVQHSYMTALDAIYMISVSLTSVGYGDHSPSSQPSRAFAIFWIFIGTLLTAKAWGSGADMFLEHQKAKLAKKNLNTKFDSKSILKIDADGSGAVNEVEFLAHMLVKMQIMDTVQLQDIRGKFSELDVTGDGFITAEDLVDPDEVLKDGPVIPA